MLIPKSGIFPSEQITSVKLTISNSPILMLALNLLNQFTRHFLKWTVCLLWLAPYVGDPSVTFIWMIFTFKIGNYSCLIVVMNEPLFFPSCFAAAHYSVFGVWRIWMFSDTNYLSGIFLPLQKFICILGCINTVDNSFHCPLTLLQRSCYSWNGHICTRVYLSKWVWDSSCITKDRL